MIKKRLVVGISGASCAMLGVMLLQEMQLQPEWETHLVLTKGGKLTLEHETEYTSQQVEALACKSYAEDDIGAAIASGSFCTAGMVVVPCSMKTLSGIACGFSTNLLLRAADVVLKERRRLVLAVRETPLSAVHLQNMLTVTQAGGMVVPPVLGMYHKPRSVNDMLRQSLSVIMRPFGLAVRGVSEWQGV